MTAYGLQGAIPSPLVLSQHFNMLHTFRTNERFRSRIESALAEMGRTLDVGRVGQLDAKTLRPVTDGLEQRAGSKPIVVLESADGSRFVFKHCEPALAAAEEAAFALRRLGKRPAVPARAIQLDVEGVPTLGLLKPYIEFNASDELDADTTTWTDEQRAVMLLEHAWEWFLDNLDTNTSQYALLGPLRLPLDIDWDRAFSSQGRSELTRFAKYRPALPNARTFLYADYVAGKIKLPLWMLSNEARRIRRLPKEAVVAILEKYARASLKDEVEQKQFVSRMLIRRRSIEREVGTFMRALWAERKELEMRAESLREWLHHERLILWADWQLVLNSVLRGPIGTGARRALSAVRGLRGAGTPPREPAHVEPDASPPASGRPIAPAPESSSL